MKKEHKFILLFLIFLTFSYILMLKFYSKNLPFIGTSNIASTLNAILNLRGINSTFIRSDSIHTDDIIYLNNSIPLKIIFECTGVIEILILSSIIISYPTNIINRLYGLLLGIGLIYIFNMLRLVSISYVLVYYTDRFDFIDRYLWQVSLVIFISLAYTIWLKSTEQPGSLSL